MTPRRIFALLSMAFLIAASGAEPPVHGGGGTAINPVFSLWAQEYRRKTGIAVNYQPIGSGGGIRQSMDRTIDFGNTDRPLSKADLTRAKLVQFPILFIAVVPVANLPGVKSGELMLDGPTLADIYLGRLTRWNAPAIARLNPAAKLPNLPIVVVHRADSSGTTFQFTQYLSKISPAWRAEVGAETAVAWPLGSAGKGNAGVVATLQQTKGAIAYVEYAYAEQNKLTVLGLVNRAGGRVVPEMASFRAAAAGADFSKTDDFTLDLTDAPGATSWPILAPTYMLLPADAPDDVNRAILHFLSYALHEGRPLAERLHYVPLPPAAVGQVEAAWKSKLRP